MALESRFLDLCDMYLRMKFEEIKIPKDMQRDMFLWRRMMKRFADGDLRHSEDEKSATRRFAQWTLDVKLELLHKPKQIIQWSE